MKPSVLTWIFQEWVRLENDDDQTTCNVASSEQIFDQAPSDGNKLITKSQNDALSILPDLCLSEVFKHLSKIDLLNIMTAYNGLLPPTVFRSLNVLDWVGEQLTILRTDTGYGFKLTVSAKTNEKITLAYTYEISKWHEGGGFHEEKKINGIINASLANFIPFTAELFSLLRTRIGDRVIDSLNCHLATCEECTSEMQQSFASFVKRVRSVDLRTTAQLAPLVSDVFFKELAEDKGETVLRELRAVDTPYKVHDHRFYASDAILPMLARFRTLQAVAVVLPAEVVVSLLKMRMNGADEPSSMSGTWSFAVDGPLLRANMAPQLNDDYVYRSSWDKVHRIIKKDTRMAAFFYATEIKFRKSETTMHKLTINFSHKPKCCDDADCDFLH